MRLIDADALQSKATMMFGFGENRYVPQKAIRQAPTIDAVPVDHVKSWLLNIAINNVGVQSDDLSDVFEEISSRMNGLRTFSRERKENNNAED